MNKDLYSNKEFTDLKKKLNQEILRRGTFKWWDPLTVPSVGEDKTPPLTLPDTDKQIQITDKTYTINNPSEGSIEQTRNINYPSQGENPSGQDPNSTDYWNHETTPNTSAAQFNVDEFKNFLVGLSKIQDINLFYGRDEVNFLAYRDPQGIEDALINAQNSELNKPLKDSDVSPTKNDPNGGIKDHKNPNYPVENHPITYPMENGEFVMPSGEYDGEELKSHSGLGVNNFYDDYGAEPGDSNFHPYNRYVSEITRRDWNDQGHNRDELPKVIRQGGKNSIRFGTNPRNPQKGDPYISRPVFGGVAGACNVSCTGLCHTTCDNECGESCFKAGTLIETDHGPVPIEDIKIGDMVLTQSGKYHRVYNTFKRTPNIDDLIILKAHGVQNIYTTKNHPFWVKKYKGVTKSKQKDGTYYSHQYYSGPEWVEAKDLKARDKLCLSLLNPGTIKIDPAIAYITGRWIGDGWVDVKFDKRTNQNRYEYRVCCGFHECKDLEEKMDELEVIYHKDYMRPTSTCQKYHILKTKDINSVNFKICELLSKCGRYSHGKEIPQEIFNWDLDSINILLRGYFDADGHKEILRSISTVSTVSKKLNYQISQLIRMNGINPNCYEKIYSDNTGYIQGRKVKIHDTYSLSIWMDKITRNYSLFDYENGCIWSSLRTPVNPQFPYDVYNISVEDDPTYYANGVLVHNCTTTCWNRCGESCTSSCGSSCSGCSTLCYTSCKTKCENSTGYSCVKSGAKTIKITSSGGHKGIPAKNELTFTTHTCDGCSFSCQFYPNKKTECWDSGCMGKCFTSCNTGCATSCYGGCVDNNKEPGSTFKTGKGRGCSSGCTLNCIGLCGGVCEGYCIQTCWNACKQTCSDNCSWDCITECGSGCSNACNGWCGGCFSCTGTCEGKAYHRGCIGCGTKGGCTSTCQHDCDKNCVGKGCRSVCGIDNSGSCEANCRLNCMGTACTSKCNDACSGECTTCVNTCGFQCGYCTSNCSADCGAICNTTCSQKCSNSCNDNCVQSCSEDCGGCSNLCYSCVGMCIGICSVKCENACSSCSKLCGWWCDSSCNRDCFSNCSDRCISNCSGSCATHLMSETTTTVGPERPPTSDGYIYKHPKNRWEERESFKLLRDPAPYKKPVHESNAIVIITINKNRNLEVKCPEGLVYVFKQTTIHGGVYTIDESTGNISINEDMIPGIVETNKPNIDGGGGIFIVVLYYNNQVPITDNDIEVILPFGFKTVDYIHDDNKNTIIVIQRDEFLFPEEEDNGKDK